MDDAQDSEADVTTRASISVKDRIAKLKNASLPVSIVKKISSSSMDTSAAESVSSMLSASSDSNRGETDQDMQARDLEKDQLIENLRRELADQSEKHQQELLQNIATHEALQAQIRQLMETASTAEETLRSEQRLRADAQQDAVAARAEAGASREQFALLERRLADEERSGESLREGIRAVEWQMLAQEAASAEAMQQLQQSLAGRDAELTASRAALQQIQEESVTLNASIAEAIAQNREREAEHGALLRRCEAAESALTQAAADQQEERSALRQEAERRDREIAALREQLQARSTAPAEEGRRPHEAEGVGVGLGFGEEEAAATVSVDLSDLDEERRGLLSSSFRDYAAAASELHSAVRKLRRIRSALPDGDSEGEGGERGAADSDPPTLSAPVLLKLLIESKILYAVEIEKEIRANFDLNNKLLAGDPAV